LSGIFDPYGLDMDAVEQADGGAPGAHRRHLAADAIDRAVHPCLQFREHAF
jgi:hypothetical protein